MSGNPSPQHSPTDGLGVAAYVHLAGSGVAANLTVGTGKPNPGNYTLTLSLSSAGGHSNTCQLTTTEVDVNNAAYTPVGSATYYSYGAAVATVSGSGLVTAVALGEVIIEVAFPAFDNTLGNDAQAQTEPVNFIYSQIVVKVIV